MATFEEEYERVEPTLRRWLLLLLLGKRVRVRGEDHFISEGPNIIIGNHCGAFKDVAVLAKIMPRLFFFTANKAIFTREDLDRLIRKHLVRHLKDFGHVVNSMARPLKYVFLRFVVANVAKVGTIPVDLQASKREAMSRCVDYLKSGRAIVTLQGRGRINPRAPHPYVASFRRGASILAHILQTDYGISVPVTPLAMYGTHKPWVVPAKISVNVGEPMFIAPYLSSDSDRSVENFRNALQARVESLFLEIVRT